VISSRSRKRNSLAVIALAALLLLPAVMQCAGATPELTEIGIPGTVKSGRPIPVQVRLADNSGIDAVWLFYMNPTEDLYTNRSMAWNATSGAWEHVIPAQTWKGIVEWRLTVRYDNSSLNYPESGYGQIVIEGKSPPKPFPWNIVVTIAFLGVVLVMTELAFKPGFYRKTGRERARELEEEDRMKEMEAMEDRERGGEGRN